MKTILIADDSPSARRALEITLKNAGYSVLSASNGRDALKLAFDNEPHAIVSDEDMPQLKGSEMFKVLTADPEKKQIPRILISGLTASGDKPANTFAHAFIAKGPDLSAQLLEALQRLV